MHSEGANTMQNEERINGLENQVRTLKRIVYGFGCLLVAGVVVSATSLQTVPDVIQAKKFEVVNDEGKVVASFYAYMGGGMLSFSNKDGGVVAGLGSDEVNGGVYWVSTTRRGNELLESMRMKTGVWRVSLTISLRKLLESVRLQMVVCWVFSTTKVNSLLYSLTQKHQKNLVVNTHIIWSVL